jgi:hypothetical protein
MAVLLLLMTACSPHATASGSHASAARPPEAKASSSPVADSNPTPDSPSGSAPESPPATNPPADPSAPCTSVSLDASPASPQSFGTVVTLTATAGGCGSPEFRFWLITPDPPGVGLVVQGWNAQNSFTWRSANWVGPGTFGLTVDARHPGASDSGDATTSQSYQLIPVTAGPACTGVTVDASPASPQQAGTSVTFTATATGCPSPEFQWWFTVAGTELLGQGWSSSPTFTLNTQPNSQTGGYTINAQARQAGDTLMEASGQLVYMFTAPPPPPPSPTPSPQPSPVVGCTTITVTPSATSPQPVGTSITWSASTDCLNAEYRFIIDGSINIEQQDWSPKNTYVETESLAGTYTVKVWARDPAGGRAASVWIDYTFN